MPQAKSLSARSFGTRLQHPLLLESQPRLRRGPGGEEAIAELPPSQSPASLQTPRKGREDRNPSYSYVFGRRPAQSFHPPKRPPVRGRNAALRRTSGSAASLRSSRCCHQSSYSSDSPDPVGKTG